MSEEREKVRCRSCELVQWSDRANCRRCGTALPEPIVRIVERVVEKVVIRQDPQCLQKLEQASRLISTATERLTQQCVEVSSSNRLSAGSRDGSLSDDGGGGASDDRGGLREVESQTSRSCTVARNRQDHRIPQAQRDGRSGGVVASQSGSQLRFNECVGMCRQPRLVPSRQFDGRRHNGIDQADTRCTRLPRITQGHKPEIPGRQGLRENLHWIGCLRNGNRRRNSVRPLC